MIFIKNAKRYFKKCVEIKLNCLKKREGEHDVLERVVEQVLSKVDIVDVVSMYVPLKKSRSELQSALSFSSRENTLFLCLTGKTDISLFWMWSWW